MADDTLDRVRQLVADILDMPLPAVDLETSYDDVPAWDSLNIVKLAMAVESEFRVPISPDDAVNFTSVKAILEVVQRKRTQNVS